MIETLWQPIDFLDWMDHLRNCDVEDAIKELRVFDYDWESYEINETKVFKDSPNNNNRISINITPVKKQLNESINQFSMDTSMLEVTLNDQSSVMHDQRDDMNACVTQIEVATKTLNKLCYRYQYHDSKPIVESLAKMQNIIETLKSILQSKDSSENASINSTSSINDTVIDITNNTKNIFQNENAKECSIQKDIKSVDIVGNSDIDKAITKKDDIKTCSSQNTSPKNSNIQNNVTVDAKIINFQKNVRFIDKK
jgi:kinesin family protein 14